MSEPFLPRPWRIAGLVLAVALGVGLLALLSAGVWIGARAAAAYTHLRAVEETARNAVEVLSAPEQAATLIDELAADTGEARRLTSDPVWAAAEALPWIGPQLHSVSTIAAAADDIARTSLTPLADVASRFSIDSLRPVDGRIDTAIFSELAEPARIGAEGVSEAAASVASLRDEPLLTPVREAVEQVSAILDSGVVATDALARVTALLPSMLGAEGERDYLLVFQNNAEWRSLGGIVGALAVIHTADGSISLTAQGSSADFSRTDDPVIPLPAAVEQIYGTRPAQWIQNATQVPDFSVGAEIARQMWSDEMGLDVDGVIAMDPVALSYVLEATGPITLASGDVLDAGNAIQLLLNDVYQRYESREQDLFFAAAAGAVFDQLAAGRADPVALVNALSRAASERRVLIWNADAADQRVLEGTTLAGELPQTDRETARFGVYLNDGTGAKMDFYVRADTAVDWSTCALDARGLADGVAELTVTLTNTAPADAATALPNYITGGGWFGVEPGDALTVVYVYLPEGFELLDAQLSDGAGFGGGVHDGRRVVSFAPELSPGESVTMTLEARPVSAAASVVAAQVTPTIRAEQPTELASTCTAG